MTEQDHLVVVGASLAGVRAAESARMAGFDGRITLVGDELHPPYDRPSLSKDFLAAGIDPAPLPLADLEQLQESRIDLALGQRATALDTVGKRVITDAGAFDYTTAIIATGSSPITLPNTDGIRGIVSLRTLDDARTVREALDANARVVVIGGGFIGAEIASGARKRGLEATIIEAADVPLVRAVGAEMGAVLSKLHARHGTDLRCGVGVSGFIGDDHVEAVTLSDGTLVEADLVIVGIGTRPAISWLEHSGLELGNGVVCDEFLRTSDPNVFAAGDVAQWRNPLFDRSMRIEHFTAAAEQGGHAGRNAAHPGRLEAYSTVPYFWSDWYDHRIQSAGVLTDDSEVVSGDLADTHFVVLYRDGDRLSGVLTLNGQRHVMKYRKLIADGADYDTALALAASRRLASAAQH